VVGKKKKKGNWKLGKKQREAKRVEKDSRRLKEAARASAERKGNGMGTKKTGGKKEFGGAGVFGEKKKRPGEPGNFPKLSSNQTGWKRDRPVQKEFKGKTSTLGKAENN